MVNRSALNRVLKNYDSALYSQETKPGRVDIYRRGKTSPHFLFSLTDNWKPTGTPRLYGIDVVLNRIRATDLWRNDGFVEDWLKQHEKDEQSASRDRQNSVEAFLYDFRRQFQRATNDINTSSLKKVYRKEGSHGYCEPR